MDFFGYQLDKSAYHCPQCVHCQHLSLGLFCAHPLRQYPIKVEAVGFCDALAVREGK